MASVCASMPWAASTSSTAPSQAASDAGHLVGEVDVARGVDHVEHVRARRRPVARRGPSTACRTAWLLIVMPRSRSMSIRSRYCARIVPLVDDAGELQHPVGQRRLAVVDVGDDAEVADDRRVGLAGLRARRFGTRSALVHFEDAPILPRGCVPAERAASAIVRQPESQLCAAWFEHAAGGLDHTARALVGVVAGDQHPLEAEVRGVRQHRAEHRRRVAAPTPAGSDVVADVAADVAEEVREPVPHADPPEVVLAVDPPPGRVRDDADPARRGLGPSARTVATYSAKPSGLFHSARYRVCSLPR